MKTLILSLTAALLTIMGVAAQPKSSSSSDSKRVATEIEKLYRGATIKDIDKERGGYEVDILHDRKEKEVSLSSSFQWISTKYDVRSTDLPAKILEEVKRKYAGMKIDDIEFIQTPKQSYYEIELEKGGRDSRKVRVTKEGKFL